jgi:hypothetical protein
MSKAKPRRKSARCTNGRSGGNYKVGYGQPPKQHQFKPGQSGNPKGRPKGAKNESTILHNIFNRQVEMRDGGRVRKVSVLEGMLLRFTDDALKGNPKSAAFLLNRYRLTEGPPSATDDFDDDDRAIFDALMQEVETKLEKKKVKTS